MEDDNNTASKLIGIKNILDFKENADYKRLSCDEIKVLRDYITNLQQENERLTQGITLLTNKVIDMTKSKEDYELRIEKAVEYMKQSINESQLIFGWGNIQRYHDNEMNELLNILNGRSDE